MRISIYLEKMKNMIVTRSSIEEIEVVDPEIVACGPGEICDPEGMFEMIESCKICGRCV